MPDARIANTPYVLLQVESTTPALFGAEWHAPSVFWFVGGSDPDAYRQARESGRLGDLPTNHNPRFAPVLHPTLRAGVEASVTAALAWLSP